MTSTVFSSGTVIESPWLNDVNTAIYTAIANASGSPPNTTAQVVTNLSQAGGLATQDTAQTLTNKTLVAPILGTATGTSLSTTSNQVISGTGKQGYATGSGGVVTQATSKATGVTLSKSTGQITLNNAALAASTTVSFTLTNTVIEAGDILIMNHISAGTAGSYSLNAQSTAGSASINVRNISLGSLSEAIVIAFAVVKAVVS